MLLELAVCLAAALRSLFPLRRRWLTRYSWVAQQIKKIQVGSSRKVVKLSGFKRIPGARGGCILRNQPTPRSMARYYDS